jgi:hypothetical protein
MTSAAAEFAAASAVKCAAASAAAAAASAAAALLSASAFTRNDPEPATHQKTHYVLKCVPLGIKITNH